MKFVCLSDIHLVWENPIGRLDNLIESQFEKLKFVFQFAKKEGAVILQAGDIFDKPRSWGLLPRTIEFLKQFDIPIYSIMGQHDTYMYSEETRDRTNLGILAKAGLITLLGEVPIVIKDAGKYIHLHGANFGSKLPKPNNANIALGIIHASISERTIYPGQVFSTPSEFICDNRGYDAILCGDIHRSFFLEMDGCKIFNTGPLTRIEATEYNFLHKPQFAVIDTNNMSIKWQSIPHLPVQEVLSREHLDRKKESKNLLDEFVLSIQNSSSLEDKSFDHHLQEFIKANTISQSVIDIISSLMEGNQNES